MRDGRVERLALVQREDVVYRFLRTVVRVHVPEERGGLGSLGRVDERDELPAEGELAVDEVRDVLEDPDERVAVGHVDCEEDVVQVERDAGELARVERRRQLLWGRGRAS